MQQDNFKKQAQEIMDGFAIEPSEKVWQHVQKKLEPAGKKRRWLVLFFILLAIVTGAAFLFNGYTKNKTTAGNETEQQENINRPTGEVKEAESKSSALNEKENVQDQQQSTARENEIKKKASISIASRVTKRVAAKYHHDVTALEIVEENNEQKEKDIAKPVDEANQYFETAVQQTAAQDESILQIDSLQLNEEALVSMVLVPGTIENISSSDLVTNEHKQIQVSTSFNKAKKAAYTSLKKKRWLFAASVAVGKAFTGSGLFKNYAAADYSSIPNSGSGATTSPSPLSPGIAFNVGGNIMYRLSAKTNLSFGLHYQLLQTSLKVGQKAEVENADGTKSLRFGAGNSHKYTNNNHYVSLQAGVMLPVFKIGGCTGVSKSGITVSQLVHSNALQFNFSQETYYVDNSTLHKTIAGLFSGVAVDVTGKKQKGLFIEPDFFYGFSTNVPKVLLENF